MKNYFVSEKKHSEFVVSPILIFPQARDKDLRQRSCIPLILAVCRWLVAYELSNSLVCVCVCQSSKVLICFFTLQGLAEKAGIL